MEWLKLVHGATTPTPAVSFTPGDEIRVWYRIQEQEKERLGQFEGIVIRCRGSGHSKTFTVRRVTYGEGVERVFPMDSKTIARIEVLRQGRVKRSRLYFLRRIVGNGDERLPFLSLRNRRGGFIGLQRREHRSGFSHGAPPAFAPGCARLRFATCRIGTRPGLSDRRPCRRSKSPPIGPSAN